MSDEQLGIVEQAQADDGRPVADLVADFRRGPEALREAVAGLTTSQLLGYPIPGKMSVQEVVCHIADCEQLFADRLKRTIAMDRPLLLGVDGWLYVDSLDYADRDFELQLALVDVTRAQMAEGFDRLLPEDWERTAVHSETGLVTLRQLLLHAIRHMDRHVAAIREKRARYEAV